MKKTSLAFVLCLGLLGFAPPAEAAGCLKGAIVGGIAGHFAHHTLLGAISGCFIGNAVSGRSNFTYSDLGTLLGAGNADDEWRAVSSARQVQIIKASSLKGYVAHDAKLQAAIARNSEIKALDGRVAGDASLTGKLRSQGDCPDDVIAAVTDKSGNAYVFVNR